MSGVSIADYGALFVKYLPGVIKTLNNTTNARTIPTGKLDWEGEYLEKKVHVGRNHAITYVQDGGAIPPAGKQSYVAARAYRRNIVGSVKVTDNILATASSTENAAIRVVDSELRGLMEGIRKVENVMWTRDGTGVVALLGSDTSGATFTVNDARALWDGASYELRDASDSGTTRLTSFTVSSVARTPTSDGEMSVTATAALSSSGQAQGDYIVWNNSPYSAWNQSLTGLDKLIDDATGTFQNVSVTTYPRYSSPVLSNGGVARPLTPTLNRQILAMIKQESGSDPSSELVALTSVFDMISWEELYEGALRVTPDSDTVGLKAPVFQSVFGRIRPMTDPDTPYGKLFYINRSQITYARQRELGWRQGANGESGAIFMRDDNNLQYTATALGIGELFIEDRRQCGKIEDLKVAVKTAY